MLIPNQSKFTSILIWAVFLSLPGCMSMNAIDQLSNDSTYKVDILDIKQAAITEEGDVEICFTGRTQYRIGRHSAEDFYSFTLSKNDIENSLGQNPSIIEVSNDYIKTGCSTIDGVKIRELKVSESERPSKEDVTTPWNSIIYEVDIVHRNVGKYESFTIPLERYYKIEDPRFGNNQKLKLNLGRIKFNGFIGFKVFYPIAFIIDIITFPFQSMYCVHADYNPCDIRM